MSLSQSTSFPIFQIPFYKHQFVGTANNLRTLTETPRYPLISSFRTSRSKPCSHLRTISCIAGEESSPSTPISSVFVKGLPDSVSEGRLRKIFSEFGEVSNVKIITNERTRQSLGYGYVWFNNKEDAQLAVEVMNGKLDPGSQKCPPKPAGE